jgi:nitric oxide reductase subunit C
MIDRFKVSIFITLTVLFICYTFYLYHINYKTQTHADLMADKGKHIWQDLNCSACHQVYGLGGYLGPDLTNVCSRLTNQQISSKIHTGTNIMPSYNLSEEETLQLIAYLKSLNASGIASPSKLKLNIDGTIER